MSEKKVETEVKKPRKPRPSRKIPGAKVGRQSTYDPQVGKRICELVASNGCGLATLVKLYPDLPPKDTIHKWRYLFPEFRLNYARAKIEQADILAEECLEISDDKSGDSMIDRHGNAVCNTEYIGRARLRVDTRKWLAGKLLPKQYGSQIMLEEAYQENSKLKNELLELRAQLDAKHKKEY